MKKLFIVLLIVLGIIAIVIAGVVIAFTLPQDLGVKYTKADLISVNNKLGINYGSLPASKDPISSMKINGEKTINQQITQSELTALLNQPSTQWKNWPVSNVQMKINADGTIEMTGKIIAKRFEDYSIATHMPDKYKSLIADKANLVPINPSFYYKGDYEIKDGKLNGEMTN